MVKTYFKPDKTRLKGHALKQFKQAVLERDNYTCINPKCGRHDTLTVHHIIKLSQGGQDIIKNGCTLCMECHSDVELHKIDTKFITEYMEGLWELKH